MQEWASKGGKVPSWTFLNSKQNAYAYGHVSKKKVHSSHCIIQWLQKRMKVAGLNSFPGNPSLILWLDQLYWNSFYFSPFKTIYKAIQSSSHLLSRLLSTTCKSNFQCIPMFIQCTCFSPVRLFSVSLSSQ